jgi:hypothetical protein
MVGARPAFGTIFAAAFLTFEVVKVAGEVLIYQE